MRILSFFVVPLAVSGFVPSPTTRATTSLDMERRELFKAVGAAILGAPMAVNAFSQQLPDHVVEPAQQATNGRVDLNSAFVGEYKQFRGMFPHAAGKIASHGPYHKVKDIYKIPGITEHDVAMFKAYEDEFTTLPPGRAFTERINARVST